MDKSMMKGRALAHARMALEEYDYLSVVEALDEDGVEYTDDEATTIHDMIMCARVEIR